MPIYRCNKCGLIAETSTTPAGNKINCTRCSTPSTVFESVFYVEKLLERYIAALREVEALKAADTPSPQPAAQTPVTNATASAAAPLPNALPDALPLGLDLHNTALLATAKQHQPLKAWFDARQIDAQFDYALVDTSGFFDDAARMLADNFDLYAELLDRVRYAYRNSHSGLNLELAALSQKDAQAINSLCRQFYSHTLFARYHYQKPEKNVRLTLQTATTVRQFFEGGWLEWFAFIEVLQQFKTKQLSFSCARGVKVVFANEDLHELDVLVLGHGQLPICIECKTGEFRRDIDKYLRLNKRLGLGRERFIICATQLSDEQAASLSAMYELTFANLKTLGEKLHTIL
jgi:hypothetical protein